MRILCACLAGIGVLASIMDAQAQRSASNGSSVFLFSRETNLSPPGVGWSQSVIRFPTPSNDACPWLSQDPPRGLTTIRQFLDLNGASAARGHSIRWRATVVCADPVKGEVLLKDPTGVVRMNVDLSAQPVQAGQAVVVQATTGARMIRYPDLPSGSQSLPRFEAPSDIGDWYVARIRGFLHPPRTGEYTFWIASDNGSKLWLSPDEQCGRATRIASVSPYSFTSSCQWEKFPTQRSSPIHLVAGKRYYIEALHVEQEKEDNLAVAWAGPDLPRSVINGQFLSPWTNRPDQGLKGTILREFWLDYPIASLKDIYQNKPTAWFGAPWIVSPRLWVDGAAAPLEPLRMTPASAMKAAHDFPWAKMEGWISEVSDDGVYWSMFELTDQTNRLQLFVANPGREKIQPFLNARVEARGFCEGTFDERGERKPGRLWVPSLKEISAMNPREEDWLRFPVIPSGQLQSTNALVREGQRVRVRGWALEQTPGQSLTLRAVSRFTGFVSPNGTNWIQIGEPIELEMNHAIHVGLVASSDTNEALTTATFDEVRGFTGTWTNSDIGNPGPAGSVAFDGEKCVLKGAGFGMAASAGVVTSDSFHFLHQRLVGDGEIVARVLAVEKRDAWGFSNAGVMMRETLDAGSKFVYVAMTAVPIYGARLRVRRGAHIPTESVTAGQFGPFWMKLARRSDRPLTIHSSQGAPVLADQCIEAIGVLERTNLGWTLNQAFYRVIAEESSSPGTNVLAQDTLQITSVQQIRQLRAEDLAQLPPARIRGTITAVAGDLFVQDATGGLRIPASAWQRFAGAQAGQYLEMEGHCGVGGYSPVLVPHQYKPIKVLGRGRMPVPLPRTWDQLMSGREDAQWVSIRGIVRSLAARALKLQMSGGGVVPVALGFDYPEEFARRLVDAAIKLQGVCTVLANENKQLQGITLLCPAPEHVAILEPSLEDTFAQAPSPINALLIFNAQKEPSHRIKVRGVVTCEHGQTLFLQDATGGMMVEGSWRERVRPGDLVDVAGFAELHGFTPTLVEALVRKVGQGQLPAPVKARLSDLLRGWHDAQRVRMDAVVLGQKTEGPHHVLEYLWENRSFRALLWTNNGVLALLPPGSRVQLTGVLKTDAGVLSPAGGAANTFQVFLESPQDAVVLERPPWWTMKHALEVVGGLVLVLGGALAWIRMLNQQVDKRTQQLEQEIRERQQAEQQRLVEQERTRVAQDLHDELGSSLTEISMLGLLSSTPETSPAEKQNNLKEIITKSRDLVAALDEIVWAVNPKNDSAASLANYFCRHAQRFFALFSIQCRLAVPAALPDSPLASRPRHCLFLAFKEALNNVARHARATEVVLAFDVREAQLEITITDNGCGFDAGQAAACAADGLANQRHRLEALGGCCQITSQPGHGSTVRLVLPLREAHL